MGSLWGLSGFQWVSVGSIWVMMEFLWVIMGFLWVPVGLRGPLRVTMGSLWVPMGSVRALCGVPIGVRTPRRSLCVTPQPTAPPSGGEEQLGGSCRHTQQLLSLLLDGPRGAAAFRPLPPLPPPPRDVVELPLPQRSAGPAAGAGRGDAPIGAAAGTESRMEALQQCHRLPPT
ncbi:uncharacterized protein LOC107049632 isoform X10 [Gallus gallus]|uniref:uncharacterized protein LOC107049632 isoform X10 n=1 Tax=Gallus gallus TaxID=9031 RepID=UPI001AE637B0|nr:uncharacterized protein LOC107049632 isoform X10 [Gallus gallus]